LAGRFLVTRKEELRRIRFQGDANVTGELPSTMLVMISDEAAGGRIVVELGAFVRWNAELDRQLEELEARVLEAVPQLAVRGSLCRVSIQAG
jgi:hypothetical protein